MFDVQKCGGAASAPGITNNTDVTALGAVFSGPGRIMDFQEAALGMAEQMGEEDGDTDNDVDVQKYARAASAPGITNNADMTAPGAVISRSSASWTSDKPLWVWQTGRAKERVVLLPSKAEPGISLCPKKRHAARKSPSVLTMPP